MTRTALAAGLVLIAGLCHANDATQQLQDRVAVEKLEFLCRGDGGTVGANPSFCSGGLDVSPSAAREQLEAYWADLMGTDPPPAHADAVHTLQGYFDHRWREAYPADARRLDAQAAAQHEARYAKAVGKKSSDQLCVDYSRSHSKSARAELATRNALTDAEWQAIDQHTVRVGMSELTLLCALGDAKVNRTVTANAVRKQYVYGDRSYVYVENGRVVAFQD